MREAAILGILAIAGCQQAPAGPGEPVTRVEIGKGTSTASAAPSRVVESGPPSACEKATFEGIPLTHCVADPAKDRITTALGPASGGVYRSFAALAQGLGAQAESVLFAVNGGMFDEDGKPIGYYVEDSNRLKELNRKDGGGNFHLKPNGVFFGTGGKWQVMASEDFYAKVGDRPAFGTQSGPMLVIAGRIHPEITEDGPSRVIRNGVGVDAVGKAHFVLSEAPVSFGKFARYFRDVLRTPNALYLDGSVSALWDPREQRRDETVPLGPLIVVTERDPAE